MLEHLGAHRVGRPARVLVRWRSSHEEISLEEGGAETLPPRDLDATLAQLEPENSRRRVGIEKSRREITGSGADVEHTTAGLEISEEPQEEPPAEVLSGVLGGRFRVLGPVPIPVVSVVRRASRVEALRRLALHGRR